MTNEECACRQAEHANIARELLTALEESQRELHACQAVIHLVGGFDPAYVNGALASIKKSDAVIARARKVL